jgi:two-component system cell cycle response regulator
MAARILIVEDNQNNLALMAYLLKAFGHQVVTASDGIEAMERLTPRPDAVLMDLQMPRMDGYQAAHEIRSRREMAGVPVIAVTALAKVGDRDRVLKSGFDGYLAKPIDPETFVRDIDAFLPEPLRSHGATPVAAPSAPDTSGQR